MNIFGPRGGVNELRADESKREIDLDREFPLSKIPHELTRRFLIACGTVPSEQLETYAAAAKSIEADFVRIRAGTWHDTLKQLRNAYDPSLHRAILLIGHGGQVPSKIVRYDGTPAYSDWFLQDIDGDGTPDVPIGRVFGDTETVLSHLDPNMIDSDIAVIFDSTPWRSDRHVVALRKLGFNVYILPRFKEKHARLLAVSEFVLQFSDGRYEKRIHGSPEAWLSHNSLVLDFKQAQSIQFVGYPVVFSEACTTAREGPLLRAFLSRGACYVGSPLETVNNTEPFDSWRECIAADGWKFGFLDLLDSYSTIGEVKVNVDATLFQNLPDKLRKVVNAMAREKGASDIKHDEVLSVLEWHLFGNPLRLSTRGPNASFEPDRIVVDT